MLVGFTAFLTLDNAMMKNKEYLLKDKKCQRVTSVILIKTPVRPIMLMSNYFRFIAKIICSCVLLVSCGSF